MGGGGREMGRFGHHDNYTKTICSEQSDITRQARTRKRLQRGRTRHSYGSDFYSAWGGTAIFRPGV